MLRKYFYTKMLDLYLCRRCAEYSNAEAYDNNCEELEIFYEGEMRDISAQIRTVKNIAVDLIGKQTAIDIRHEARKDSQMLYENKVYWIPTEPKELVEYAKRYANNENVMEIFNKMIGE